MNNSFNNSAARKIVWFLAALLIFIISLWLLMAPAAPPVMPEGGFTLPTPSKKVSYLELNTGSHTGYLRLSGTLETKRTLPVTLTISGKVTRIPSHIENGAKVKRGELIARMDDLPYRLAVEQAQQAVLEAHIAHEQMEAEAEQAKSNWEKSGLQGQPSALALKKPQRSLSLSKVNAAKLQLKEAKQRLAQTVLNAPFTGVISAFKLVEHQQVQAGTVLFELVDTQRLTVRLSLSESQWQALGDLNSDSEIALLDDQDQSIGVAHLHHVAPILNTETQQRSVFIDVQRNDNTPPIGTFIHARLVTKAFADSVKVPSSSVLQSGHVWLIDDQHTLHKHPVTRLFEEGEHSIIRLQGQASAWRIAAIPLSSFIEGETVVEQPFSPASAIE